MAWDKGAGLFFCSALESPSCTERISVSGDNSSKNRRVVEEKANLAVPCLHPVPVPEALRTHVSFRGFFLRAALGLLAPHQSLDQ